MAIKVQGSYKPLSKRLKHIMRTMPGEGERWVHESTEEHRKILIGHLDHQGRGGQPPPLSDATKKIYEQSGEPDGSGIRDHIVTEYRATRHLFRGLVGIPKGKPGLVAQVQDQGAIIRVTEKMRGYLAAHGIFLRQDTEYIEIPARKFWQQSLRRAKTRAIRRLQRILK